MPHSRLRILIPAALGLLAVGAGLTALHLSPGGASSPPVKHPASDHAAGTALLVPSSPTAAAVATPSATASPTPRPSAGKPAPTGTPPPPTGAYPYPEDAGGNVQSGELTVTPNQVPAASSTVVTITASSSGWVPGQEIFVYLGQRYVLTMAGPGATDRLTVASSSVGSAGITVSGFQFPGNSPAAPLDGVGTATLRVGS